MSNGAAILAVLAGVLYVADVLIKVVALGLVPANRRPSSGMAWLLLILAVPFLGLFLFLVLGRTKLERQRRERQREVNERIRESVLDSPRPEIPGPAYVASVAACKVMVPRRSGLIVNVSSFGARAHLHSVLYGVSKAGLDKMAHDLAVELRPHGVSAVSLWPGLVQTELLLASGLRDVAGFAIADGETPEFVGRVVLALASDPELPARSGSSFVCAELAIEYGITEDDGRQPLSHRTAFGGGPFFAYRP